MDYIMHFQKNLNEKWMPESRVLLHLPGKMFRLQLLVAALI